jgi:hypothetical protein
MLVVIYNSIWSDGWSLCETDIGVSVCICGRYRTVWDWCLWETQVCVETRGVCGKHESVWRVVVSVRDRPQCERASGAQVTCGDVRRVVA